VTVAGTVATPGPLVLRDTTVSVAWAALIVTVRVPVAPWVTGRVAGRRLVSVGPAERTVIVLWRLLPLSEAVIVAGPGEMETTGTATATAPAGTETDAGTEATVGSVLARVIVVELNWGAVIVAVRVPLVPCVGVRVVGSRLVRVGSGHRLELAEAVEVRVLPSGPFSVQTRLLPLKGTRKAPWS
jgi:hypothetical protein